MMESPIAESQLESMPDELLLMVTKILTPQDALRHVESRHRVAYKKGIGKLLPLCLASKTIAAVVQPVIFGQVMISQSTELILLLRTLIENPRMGDYIQSLEFSTRFLRQDPEYEPLDLETLRGLDPELNSILPEGPAGMTSREENDLRSNLYRMVFDRAPTVQKAIVNAPFWAVRGLSQRHLSAFGLASMVAHNGGAVPQALPYRPAKTIRTLIVEGSGRYQGLAEGLPRQISGFWHRETADDSRLEKIIWFNDDTTWFDCLPAQQWASDGLRGQMASLTTLILAGSSCRFSDIAVICDSFPSLKELSIVSNYMNFCLNNLNCRTDLTDGLSPDATRLCLTRSITKLTYLESLQLDLVTGPANSRLLGENRGLDLSSLSRLVQATISFRLVLANKASASKGIKYDPSLFLPQSLEKLNIVVHGYRCEAGSNLVNFLEGLHTVCKYGFPRLRQFRYKYATGHPSLGQTVNPRCICICARDPHEDYCTYDSDSDLPCAYLPWLPTEKFRALRRKFGQRGIRLSKRTSELYVVTGATTVAP